MDAPLPRFRLEKLEERVRGDCIASVLTRSENLSAPVARDSSAKLVVFAATVPNAAANLSPEAKAASATSSAALIASSVAALGFSARSAADLLTLVRAPFAAEDCLAINFDSRLNRDSI